MYFARIRILNLFEQVVALMGAHTLGRNRIGNSGHSGSYVVGKLFVYHSLHIAEYSYIDSTFCLLIT